MLLLDLDHFKNVNDTYGHTVGDAVLRELARRLASCVREVDTVARYGKCCEAVAEFCDRRGFDALSVSVVDEFVTCQVSVVLPPCWIAERPTDSVQVGATGVGGVTVTATVAEQVMVSPLRPFAVSV